MEVQIQTYVDASKKGRNGILKNSSLGWWKCSWRGGKETGPEAIIPWLTAEHGFRGTLDLSSNISCVTLLLSLRISQILDLNSTAHWLPLSQIKFPHSTTSPQKDSESIITQTSFLMQWRNLLDSRCNKVSMQWNAKSSMAHPSVLPVVRHSTADYSPQAGPLTSNLSSFSPSFRVLIMESGSMGEGFTWYGSH